jgi:hypothetical protein
MMAGARFSGTSWELLHDLSISVCLKIKQKNRFEVVPRGSSRLKENQQGTTSKTLRVFLRVRPFRNRELRGNYVGTRELPQRKSRSLSHLHVNHSGSLRNGSEWPEWMGLNANPHSGGVHHE